MSVYRQEWSINPSLQSPCHQTRLTEPAVKKNKRSWLHRTYEDAKAICFRSSVFPVLAKQGEKAYKKKIRLHGFVCPYDQSVFMYERTSAFSLKQSSNNLREQSYYCCTSIKRTSGSPSGRFCSSRNRNVSGSTSRKKKRPSASDSKSRYA